MTCVALLPVVLPPPGRSPPGALIDAVRAALGPRVAIVSLQTFCMNWKGALKRENGETPRCPPLGAFGSYA